MRAISAANGDQTHIKRVGLLAAFAITAHNLPEGLATFLATLENPVLGIPLAAAIAIHNIPEGVSIAIPVYYATGSKQKALIATCLSALAEPLGAIIGYAILAPILTPAVFAVVFGMIAGAMVFLALDELLPTAKRYAQGHETVYGMVSRHGRSGGKPRAVQVGHHHFRPCLLPRGRGDEITCRVMPGHVCWCQNPRRSRRCAGNSCSRSCWDCPLVFSVRFVCELASICVRTAAGVELGNTQVLLLQNEAHRSRNMRRRHGGSAACVL